MLSQRQHKSVISVQWWAAYRYVNVHNRLTSSVTYHSSNLTIQRNLKAALTAEKNGKRSKSAKKIKIHCFIRNCIVLNYDTPTKDVHCIGMGPQRTISKQHTTTKYLHILDVEQSTQLQFNFTKVTTDASWASERIFLIYSANTRTKVGYYVQAIIQEQFNSISRRVKNWYWASLNYCRLRPTVCDVMVLTNNYLFVINNKVSYIVMLRFSSGYLPIYQIFMTFRQRVWNGVIQYWLTQENKGSTLTENGPKTGKMHP